MPVTLSMYFYRVAQEKIQKEFEKNNRLLHWDDIEVIVQENDPNKAVDIFYSAVVDHHPVDGKPCYLLPPVPPWMAHDGFKRAYIAYTLGAYVGRLDELNTKNVLKILNVLNGKQSCGYVQILSWCTLAQWVSFQRSIFNDDQQKQLIDAIGGSVSELVGALIFLDSMIQMQYWDELWTVLEHADKKIRYNVQQAMWRDFLCRNQIKLAQKKMTIKTIKPFRSSIHNFCQSVSLVGLSGFHPKDMYHHSEDQQVQIARFLQEQSEPYISLAGRYHQQCWDRI